MHVRSTTPSRSADTTIADEAALDELLARPLSRTDRVLLAVTGLGFAAACGLAVLISEQLS